MYFTTHSIPYLDWLFVFCEAYPGGGGKIPECNMPSKYTRKNMPGLCQVFTDLQLCQMKGEREDIICNYILSSFSL
jgi:hypothetical protein